MTGASDLRTAAAASEAALAPYHILDTAREAAYDGLVQLAGDLCETPVALLTLFETGRQWFKAAVGFDGTETTLQDSLCQHAIQAGELLVIPDTSTDPRTRNNVLVTGEPGIGFYAGAPLRTPDGTFLGTLCVIDLAPRPDGLTTAQATGLRVLADQVMATLELRRLLHARDTALDAGSVERDRLASSEAHWRGLFEGLREGFMVGQVVRDDRGKVIDWRYLEANPAFCAVLGQPLDQVIGRTMREIAPAIPQRWIDFTGRAVDEGRPATFTQLATDGRGQFDGRTFPIGDDQFAVIFLDVTERALAERRQAALIAISDRIRDLERIEDMAAATSEIVGELLGVARTGFGRLDAVRETIDVSSEWTAPDVISIIGTHRYADYGAALLADILAGEPLIIDDVLTDPRTADDPAPMQAVGVGAQVQMPLRERGRTVATFFVHHGQARQWTEDEVLFLCDVADRLEIEVRRKEIDTRRDLQNQEMSHRLKNTLAIVQAIASQTLKPVAERAAVDNFERRLSALATAHDVLLEAEWEAAPLGRVIRSVLDSAGQDGRVKLSGPLVELSPRAVLSASLLIHELATNAAKYGALSAPAGTVTVDWHIRRQDGRDVLFLVWIERGGPPASVPTGRGFGSRLINMGLVGTGGVNLDYSPTGFAARMSAPVDDLTRP